jgi:hypothetical protein
VHENSAQCTQKTKILDYWRMSCTDELHGCQAKRVEDLVIWQLVEELKTMVYQLTETGPAAKDWEFRDQLRDAMGSVTRNMSEGFGRFRHQEFVCISATREVYCLRRLTLSVMV